MVAPLALLQDNNPLSEDKLLVKTTSAPIENQTREYSNSGKTLGLDSTSEYISPLPPTEPELPDSDVLPEETQATGHFSSIDSTTDLSPIALITVPSFLIALGIFVYIRRQV